MFLSSLEVRASRRNVYPYSRVSRINVVFDKFISILSTLVNLASSTIFKVFGMTRSGIEPRSPRPLANSLTARLMENSNMFLAVGLVQDSLFPQN